MALAAALATCLPPASRAAAPSCSIERIASLKIEVGRHLALTQVKINGNPAWMGIDTGAQTTVLTPAAAARLGLPHDSTRRTNIISAAGATLVQNVHISDMQLGDTIFSDLSVAAVMLDRP